MTSTQEIRNRLRASQVPFLSNDNIADHLEAGDITVMRAEVEDSVRQLLDVLLIDWRSDHNTDDTPRRVAKLLVDEVFAGRYQPQPPVTTFPNIHEAQGIVTVGPIDVRSACSHHLVPILGRAWVGIVPGERLIGLSKFSRLIQWIMTRPQIQEEAIEQVADLLEFHTKPKGLAVVIKANHLCCQWRGVKDHSVMTSSVMRGVFFDDSRARLEFLKLIEDRT